MDKAIVTVMVEGSSIKKDLQIPIDISVKEISVALKKSLNLEEMNINISGYYMKIENPIGFLKGNDNLKKFNVCDGTRITLL